MSIFDDLIEKIKNNISYNFAQQLNNEAIVEGGFTVKTSESGEIVVETENPKLIQMYLNNVWKKVRG